MREAMEAPVMRDQGRPGERPVSCRLRGRRLDGVHGRGCAGADARRTRQVQVRALILTQGVEEFDDAGGVVSEAMLVILG